jgi:radical SAM superfamily enzyme YgiQ (UPF0313 family)
MSKPVLLINAPFHGLYGSLKSAVSYYFPLGVGYLAAYLEKNGYQVDLLVEERGISLQDSLLALLNKKDYLLVGFSAMTSAFPGAVRMAETVRQRCPRVPIILGGPHASGIGATLLEDHPQFDYLCLGEGERTLLELVDHLETGQPRRHEIKGLVWRSEAGGVTVNLPRPFFDAIDEFPFPARHLVNFASFSVSSHVTASDGHSATVISSRGCPFDCVFCAAHLTVGKKYRMRSEDSIIAELKMLRDQYQVRYVFFQDDTMTLARKRIASLCRRLKKEKLNINFGCFSRVEVFDAELGRMLAQAGCRLVIFGIESGVPEVLEKISKHISLKQAKQAIINCRDNNIQSYASFVVGFPFETKAQIRQTLAFGKSLDATRVTFNPFVPFPGCSLYDAAKHKPPRVDGWTRFLTTSEPPFDMTPGVPAPKLKAMVDRAHLEYYLSPRRLWRLVSSIRSPGELVAMIKAAMGMLSEVARYSAGKIRQPSDHPSDCRMKNAL